MTDFQDCNASAEIEEGDRFDGCGVAQYPSSITITPQFISGLALMPINRINQLDANAKSYAQQSKFIPQSSPRIGLEKMKYLKQKTGDTLVGQSSVSLPELKIHSSDDLLMDYIEMVKGVLPISDLGGSPLNQPRQGFIGRNIEKTDSSIPFSKLSKFSDWMSSYKNAKRSRDRSEDCLVLHTDLMEAKLTLAEYRIGLQNKKKTSKSILKGNTTKYGRQDIVRSLSPVSFKKVTFSKQNIVFLIYKD